MKKMCKSNKNIKRAGFRVNNYSKSICKMYFVVVVVVVVVVVAAAAAVAAAVVVVVDVGAGAGAAHRVQC